MKKGMIEIFEMLLSKATIIREQHCRHKEHHVDKSLSTASRGFVVFGNGLWLIASRGSGGNFRGCT